MSEYLPIGHGVSVQPRRVHESDVIVGIGYRHPDGKGGECEGWVPFLGRYSDFPDKGWTVESESPLTLSPSLLCRACGHHGFIREGKWVPA
jgi:hypothetical protein